MAALAPYLPHYSQDGLRDCYHGHQSESCAFPWQVSKVIEPAPEASDVLAEVAEPMLLCMGSRMGVVDKQAGMMKQCMVRKLFRLNILNNQTEISLLL